MAQLLILSQLGLLRRLNTERLIFGFDGGLTYSSPFIHKLLVRCFAHRLVTGLRRHRFYQRLAAHIEFLTAKADIKVSRVRVR